MPDIAHHLVDAGQCGHPSIVAKCPECRLTLDISTCVRDMLQWECDNPGRRESCRATEHFYEKYRLEATLVLKCGHLVGKRCFHKRLEKMMEKDRIEIEREGLCYSCRENLFCDGCSSSLLSDPSYDPLTVIRDQLGKRRDNFPMDLSATLKKHYAHRENVKKLTLTSAEQDPDAKRYCDRCFNMHNLSLMADIWLVRPNKEHEDIRFFRRGLHSTAEEASQTIYTSTAGVRDRTRAPYFDYEVETKRRNFVEALMSSQAFGQMYDKALGYRPFHEGEEARWYQKSEQAPDVRYLHLQSKGKQTESAPILLKEVESVLIVMEREASKIYEYMADELPLAWFRIQDKTGQLGVQPQPHPPEVKETRKVEEIVEVEEIEVDEVMEVNKPTEVDETAEIKDIMDIIKNMSLEEAIKLGEATEKSTRLRNSTKESEFDDSDYDDMEFDDSLFDDSVFDKAKKFEATEMDEIMDVIKVEEASVSDDATKFDEIAEINKTMDVIKVEEASGTLGRPRSRPVHTLHQQIFAALLRAPSFNEAKALVNPRVLKRVDMDVLVRRVYEILTGRGEPEKPGNELARLAPVGPPSGGKKAISDQHAQQMQIEYNI
ncbi:hypothetical protein PG990_014279 [Apiospora arundinis]